MITLVQHLRALLGNCSLAADVSLMTAADARAATLPRDHGVLYSKPIEEAIDELASPCPGARDLAKAAYYLGLQTGWRAAHRLH